MNTKSIVAVIAAATLTACSTTNQQVVQKQTTSPCTPCKCSVESTKHKNIAVANYNNQHKNIKNQPVTMPKGKPIEEEITETTISRYKVGSFIVIQ